MDSPAVHFAAEAAGLRCVAFRDLRYGDSILLAELEYPGEDEVECPKTMELLIAAVSVVRAIPNPLEVSYCEMAHVAGIKPFEDVSQHCVD
jgi:hypothetical protein